MFVDASAIVAILTREPEADILIPMLDGAIAPITSPLALYEAVVGIARKRAGEVEATTRDVVAFLEEAGIEVCALTLDHALQALLAFERFGKGRGHPAALNMGDCFSYAGARVAGVGLLFTGGDFIHTDLR